MRFILGGGRLEGSVSVGVKLETCPPPTQHQPSLEKRL